MINEDQPYKIQMSEARVAEFQRRAAARRVEIYLAPVRVEKKVVSGRRKKYD